jgi:hypothetical protein
MAMVGIVVPALARAQEPRPFEDVQRVVKRNQQVVVTDVGGGRTRGDVVNVDDASITLRWRDGLGIAQTRTIERPLVSTIRRSDRLWNGLLIGLGAGFAATEIWSYRLCGARGNDTECSAIATGVGWVAFVPSGAVIGALVDKAIGNQVIYRSAPRSKPTVELVPTLSKGKAGFTAAIRF